MPERGYQAQESPLQKLSRETGLQFPDPPNDEEARRIIARCQPPRDPNYKPSQATMEETLAAAKRFSEATGPALAKIIVDPHYKVTPGF